MAGGSGTRFWPVSRQKLPKQLTRLLGAQTMIQATIARLQPLIDLDRILIITRQDLAAQTREQLPMLPPAHIIGEPMGRDTAPCVCLAAQIVRKLDPQGICLVLPADQVIEPVTRFHDCLRRGIAEARRGGLVTYGIRPRFAATGYGYIKQGDRLPTGEGDIPVHRVSHFVEKPDAAKAASYLADGSYLWNSGMFTWQCDVVLGELNAHCPELPAALEPVMRHWATDRFDQKLGEVYPTVRKISIDYALMEKAREVKVVTADFDWDDLGSWDAIYDHLKPDADGVIHHGQTLAVNCRDSLLFAGGKQVVTAVGLEGVTVVATDDAVLVCAKGQSQQVKAIVEKLTERKLDGLL